MSGVGYPGGLGGENSLIEEVEGVVFEADAAEGGGHLSWLRLPSEQNLFSAPRWEDWNEAILLSMKVLIFEDNLIWSERLRKTVTGLGHEAIVISRLKAVLPDGDVAILNLGSETLWSSELVAGLKAKGFHLVGHAGHKEKQKLQEGREEGVDQVVSNSTLTFKLDDVLAKVPSK